MNLRQFSEIAFLNKMNELGFYRYKKLFWFRPVGEDLVQFFAVSRYYGGDISISFSFWPYCVEMRDSLLGKTTDGFRYDAELIYSKRFPNTRFHFRMEFLHDEDPRILINAAVHMYERIVEPLFKSIITLQDLLEFKKTYYLLYDYCSQYTYDYGRGFSVVPTPQQTYQSFACPDESIDLLGGELPLFDDWLNDVISNASPSYRDKRNSHFPSKIDHYKDIGSDSDVVISLYCLGKREEAMNLARKGIETVHKDALLWWGRGALANGQFDMFEKLLSEYVRKSKEITATLLERSAKM